MKSRTTKEFWKLHNTLPTSVQVQAKVVYLRWQKDPFHASLDFKRISRKLPVYSIRIGRSWRALGQRKGYRHLVLDRLPRGLQYASQ
jgi:hypothetical protein